MGPGSRWALLILFHGSLFIMGFQGHHLLFDLRERLQKSNRLFELEFQLLGSEPKFAHEWSEWF